MTGSAHRRDTAPRSEGWGVLWIARFAVRRAHKAGYVSTNVPVPRDVLMHAITESMMVIGPA